MADAGIEVLASSIWLQYFANLELSTQVIQDDASAYVELARRPLGVVAAITPWNFPLTLAFWKIAPALLAGNTLVLKPSPFTPLTTLKVGEILRDVFPPGVVNIVSGGDTLGASMTTHPVPRKISFTGSVETGKKVAQSAAPDLKRVTLELGGNDPAIILDDADPALVASAIFNGAFANNGQVCSAIKRVYVPEALYDDVVDGLAAEARAIKVGEGNEDGVKLGPINNEPQYERVKELVADALSHGATAVTGGKAMDRPGYFFEPTILTGLSDGTRIVDEEQFGPALPVVPYRDLGDAIDRANASALRALRLGVGDGWRQSRRCCRPTRMRDGVGEHASRPGTAAAFRWLQVERHRRGERPVGPGRVQRIPGGAPLPTLSADVSRLSSSELSELSVPSELSGGRRSGAALGVLLELLHIGPSLLECGAGRLGRRLGAVQQPVVAVPLRGREGEHGGGETVGRVGRRSDLAVEIVDQRLQHTLVGRGDVRLRLGGDGCEVRDGSRDGVVGCRRHPGGGQHERVDAIVAEDPREIVRGLLHRAVALNGLVELLQRGDVGTEVRRQRALARPESLGRVDLPDGRVEGVDPVGDLGGGLGLDPSQRRGHRAGPAAPCGRRAWPRPPGR